MGTSAGHCTLHYGHAYVSTTLFLLQMYKGTPYRKKRCLSGIAQITSPLPPSPQFGQVVQLFLDVKNDVLARITKPSNNDYDNDGSDNCDYNFGTFDNFGAFDNFGVK